MEQEGQGGHVGLRYIYIYIYIIIRGGGADFRCRRAFFVFFFHFFFRFTEIGSSEFVGPRTKSALRDEGYA